ncbi:MAG: CBS domain-containing protein [Oscillospiraceae bacterium]|nr:CBS domain-containing protein [Oscillospiraceae bacterium]
MNFIGLMQHKRDLAYLYDYKTLKQGLELMRNHGYEAVPVISQDGRYIGTVNEGDFLWHIIDFGGYEKVKEHTIKDIVRRGCNKAVPITASPEELREAVMEYHFVPVIDDRGMFMGIVTRRALSDYFFEQSKVAETEKKKGAKRSAMMDVVNI